MSSTLKIPANDFGISDWSHHMHPDKIGPYLIDRKIGSGGMGNVYHGTHEETGDAAAVKVLPASMAREEGFVLRFSREVDALRKVSSPNIVQIFQDGQTADGSYYFSMEFVDGETLTSLISRRKRLPWPEVVDISLQICTALKAAHNAGIVHRDLKPSNLMLSKDGNVKLADFGVAHVFATTRLTRTGGVVGTAEYMSPEQARGQRATKLSDLYSLGAVMYVMLTGRPPFTGKTAAEILQKHQFAQFDRPTHYVPDLPRLLEAFVIQLLEKQPKKRFPDAFVAIRQLTNIRSRIEFEENARAQDKTAVADPSAAGKTIGLAEDKTSGSSVEYDSPSRGPATMVRDAIREDIERKLQKSAVARFFDNTFVLIASLGLIIATGYFLSRNNGPEPAEELARAKEILGGKPGNAWLHARDDVFEPMVAEELFPEQHEEIRKLIRQVDQYEFCRSLKMTTPADGTAQSELQRLIAKAFESYSAGEIANAIEQLNTVQALLSADDTYLREFLKTTLDDWNEGQAAAGRRALLLEIVTEATSAVAGQKDSENVASRLNAAIKSYADDRSVAEEIQKCRDLLSQLTVTKE